MTYFWTDNLTSGTSPRDPKRQYRFIVELNGLENGASWYAKSVTKPSMTISDTAHTYLNHKFYYPGRVDWSPINVTLVDPVSPDAAAETFKIIQAAGYRIPGDTDTTPGSENLLTISKTTAVGRLGGVTIRQIDAEGVDLETWTLRNPFITSVNLGDLNYESDGLSTNGMFLIMSLGSINFL